MVTFMFVGVTIFCAALVVLYLTISFARLVRFSDQQSDFDPLMGLIAVTLIAAVGKFLWGMR